MTTVLNSWKEIAKFLNCGVRTVQRWEQDHQLPVHRIAETPKSPVFAFESELLNWLRGRECDNGQKLSGDTALRDSSRELLVIHHELLETTKRLRAEHHLRLSMLRENLAVTQHILGVTVTQKRASAAAA